MTPEEKEIDQTDETPEIPQDYEVLSEIITSIARHQELTINVQKGSHVTFNIRLSGPRDLDEIKLDKIELDEYARYLSAARAGAHVRFSDAGARAAVAPAWGSTFETLASIFRFYANTFKEAFLHPFSTSVIDKTTGRVIHSGKGGEQTYLASRPHNSE